MNRAADEADLAAAAPAGQAKRLAIRDAATLVIVDGKAAGARILMGQRRADLAFLAGKFVFPGGRVDPADKSAPSADELPALETGKLLRAMRGRPSVARARALAMAAVRETREEAGLTFGDPELPPLAGLTYFARAITPPGRVRRYDTRFFMARASELSSAELSGDGELTGLAWFTLDEALALDLPRITRMILADVAALTSQPATASAPTIQVPFYRMLRSQFVRDLL